MNAFNPAFIASASALLALALPLTAQTNAIPDPRHIANGWIIPSEGYADQPYIVKTGDGAWLSVITTGTGVEGATGQHVVSMRTTNHGRSWSKPVDVEPADGPEASYAVLLKVPSGRVYCFYNHNTDKVREVKREDKGAYARVDSLGHYVFKFSDDHGQSWSPRRHDIPVREFDCDRTNIYGGKLRFFWNVGRPLIHSNAAVLVLHKVGAMGADFFAQSEGAFLRSDNLLTERDPEKIRFETMPEGTVGLRTPAGGGRVSEEQSIAALSDGSLYCVYRTVDGSPACAYSRDGGRHWTPPAYASYTPGGRRIKHPRAANFVWRCENGKFLYWFHNHSGAAARQRADWDPYSDRNPAWLVAGVERDTPAGKVIHWSQPEILLYDDDPYIRMSYPDLVEDDGKFYVTETQKNIGRVHEIPSVLVQGLFNQFEARTVATNGLLLSASGNSIARELRMPRLPELNTRDNGAPDHRTKDLRRGFTIDVWLHPDAVAGEQIILDSRTATGAGIALSVAASGSGLTLTVNDGRTESRWSSDSGVLQSHKRNHVIAIVDGGPKIVSFVVNGVFCDGGEERQFGWGRYNPNLRTPNGANTLRVAPGFSGSVDSLRLYGRALRVSEAVANFRAGVQ